MRMTSNHVMPLIYTITMIRSVLLGLKAPLTFLNGPTGQGTHMSMGTEGTRERVEEEGESVSSSSSSS